MLDARGKLKCLNNIVAIAMADGFVCEDEIPILHALCRRLGFDETILESLIKQGPPIVKLQIDSIQEKIAYMHDCIAVAIADDVLHPREREFCLRVARGLNLDGDMVNEMIATTMSKST